MTPVLTEQNSAYVPVHCPHCGRWAFDSAACHVAIATRAGTLVLQSGAGTFVCAGCQTISETRISSRGRLYLVPVRPRGNRFARGPR